MSWKTVKFSADSDHTLVRCDVCNYTAWTETGMCERCVYCVTCEVPWLEEPACNCGEPEESTTEGGENNPCGTCLNTGLRWGSDGNGEGWCPRCPA